jgi:hypothetical protein
LAKASPSGSSDARRSGACDRIDRLAHHFLLLLEAEGCAPQRAKLRKKREPQIAGNRAAIDRHAPAGARQRGKARSDGK